jgi:hypothetical protein
VQKAFVFVRSGQAWSQQAGLMPPSAGMMDSNVSISGDTVVVQGAYSANATGRDDFIFSRSNSVWTATTYHVYGPAAPYSTYTGGDVAVSGSMVVDSMAWSDMFGYFYYHDLVDSKYYSRRADDHVPTATNSAPGNGFGYAVATNGDTVVVGDYIDNDSAGAVYVWERQAAGWVQTAKLTGMDVRPGDLFGWVIAMDQDTLAVWASVSRAVYIFVRSGDSWIQQAKLTSAEADNNGNDFGSWLALSGDTLVIGTRTHTSLHYPSVYVFVRKNNIWSQEAHLVRLESPLLPSVPDPYGSGTIDGDTLAFPDLHKGLPCTDVYTRSGTTWSLQTQITPPGLESSSSYRSLYPVISGDYLVLGAYKYSSPYPSAAYVYRRNGTSWELQNRLDGPDGLPFNVYSATIEGNLIVATGLYGNQRGVGVFVNQNNKWVYQTRLARADVPLGTVVDDLFGTTIPALSGNTAVIGAPGAVMPGAFVFTLSAPPVSTTPPASTPSPGTTAPVSTPPTSSPMVSTTPPAATNVITTTVTATPTAPPSATSSWVSGVIGAAAALALAAVVFAVYSRRDKT